MVAGLFRPHPRNVRTGTFLLQFRSLIFIWDERLNRKAHTGALRCREGCAQAHIKKYQDLINPFRHDARFIVHHDTVPLRGRLLLVLPAALWFTWLFDINFTWLAFSPLFGADWHLFPSQGKLRLRCFFLIWLVLIFSGWLRPRRIGLLRME